MAAQRSVKRKWPEPKQNAPPAMRVVWPMTVIGTSDNGINDR
jgi:hypothetical protein